MRNLFKQTFLFINNLKQKKMKVKSIFRAMAIMTAILAVNINVHAQNVGAANQPATGFTLNARSLTLEVGATHTLRISGLADAQAAKATWESSNKEVASVDRAGTVTALKEGKATITATVDREKASIDVTVTPKMSKDDQRTDGKEVKPTGDTRAAGEVKPTGDTRAAGDVRASAMTLSDTKVELKARSTRTLSVAGLAAGEKAVWESSNKDVVTVDQTGKLTALKAGRATITVTVGAEKRTCDVIVNK